MSNEINDIVVDVNDYSFLEAERSLHRSIVRPIDTDAMLKEMFWLEFESSRMAMGWASGFPDWDVKGQLVRMSYLHTEHMRQLLERIEELPGPSIGRRAWTPDHVADAFERLSLAPSAEAFTLGYRVVLTQLYDKYDRLAKRLDPILDAPTVDRLRRIEADRHELLSWRSEEGRYAFIDDPARREALAAWEEYAHAVWASLETAARQPEGKAPSWPAYPAEKPAGPVPSVAARDPRYPLVDLTKYKSAMFDPKSPTYDSVKHMVFINASEMSAAETLTYLYYGVRRMPMEFYCDLARHTWDEVRHSQMGVRRLKQMGYRTEDFSWHPSTVLSADNVKTAFPEFYSALTMVMEPCSFIKKRKSIDAFLEHGDPLSSVQSEYDIADERLHVGFGKKWGAKLYEHVDDLVTAATVERKAKAMHLEKMGYSREEIDGVLDSFPEFCGFATMDLVYDKY